MVRAQKRQELYSNLAGAFEEYRLRVGELGEKEDELGGGESTAFGRARSVGV